MFKIRLKNLGIISITIILTLGFSVSLQSLLAAWTAPTAVAPANNTTSPLNRGPIGQDKIGGLVLNSGNISVNGLVVKNGGIEVSKGEIRIGNSGALCTGDISGSLRYNSSNANLEFCNGLTWSNLSNTPTQSCFIANGGGTQIWDGTSWGACTLSGCNSGYHQEGNACLISTLACAITNGTGVQTWNGTA